MPDIISIGLSTHLATVVGLGTTPVNITLITRGEPGLFSAPTLDMSLSDGIEATADISVSSGLFLGDSRKLKSNFLEGVSMGGSAELGIGPHLSVGGSHAATPVGLGIVSVNIQIGVGIAASPATGVQPSGTYNYAPKVFTIIKF